MTATTTQQKRTSVTREAPIRGSVVDYQDWLVEQLRAGVDGYFTGASINDCAWAERVIRAEEQRDRSRQTLVQTLVNTCHWPDCASRCEILTRYGKCSVLDAIADDPPTADAPHAKVQRDDLITLRIERDTAIARAKTAEAEVARLHQAFAESIERREGRGNKP